MHPVLIDSYPYFELEKQVQSMIYAHFKSYLEDQFYSENIPILIQQFCFSEKQIHIKNKKIYCKNVPEHVEGAFFESLEKQYLALTHKDNIMSLIQKQEYMEDGTPIDPKMIKNKK